MNFMAWGSDWLHEMRTSHLSQDVTYSRPGKFEIELPATFSRTTRTLDSGQGVLIAYESWSFIVLRQDLVHNSVAITPEVGDIVSYVRDNKTYRYDVNNMGGEPCWRDHDRYKKAIVIFTDAYDNG